MTAAGSNMAEKASHKLTTQLSQCAKTDWLRWVKTAAVLLAYFSEGISATMVGLCLVHMSLLFEVDTQDFYVAFIGQGLGGILGVLANCLFFSRVSCEVQFAAVTALAVVVETLSPWAGLYGYAAFSSTAYFVYGYVESCYPAYLSHLWEGSRLQAPVVQSCFLLYTAGTLLTPLFATRFLSPLHDSTAVAHNVTWPASANGSNASLVVSQLEGAVELTTVRWAFSIIGLCLSVTVVIFGVVAACGKTTTLQSASNVYMVQAATATSAAASADDGISSQQQQQQQSSILESLFVFLAMALTFAYMFTVAGFTSYLQVFATMGLGWTVNQGAYLNATCSAGRAVARLAATCCSAFLKPQLLVVLCLVTWLAGLILMYPAAEGLLPDVYMWLGVCAVGAGSAAVLPCTYLWTARACNGLSAKKAAVITLAVYGGFMVGQTVQGFLYSAYGHVTVVLVALSGCIAQCLMAASLLPISRCMATRHKASASVALVSRRESVIPAA